ncbi:MAG: hypothetical protein AB7V14_12465 [Kiritimatiellia bacterium]
MKIYALTALAIMISTAATGQENGHPAADKHKTLPFPASGITNIFFPGYQTMWDEQAQDIRLFIVKLSHRKDPTRVYAAQIGDYIGDYRFDHTTAPGKNMELYFVKSNAIAIIRARGQSETDKNTVVFPAPDVQ